MDILYLSHCVPYPPNKGEKIRAYHEIRALAAAGHRVHLACFGRTPDDVSQAEALRNECASVYAEARGFHSALPYAAVRFAVGDCLNVAFYRSSRMRRYVQRLCAEIRFDATVAYALPMAPYAPAGVPILFDMQDVDSEKWLEYAKMKRFGFLYRCEALRLRRQEIRFARGAASTLLTARQETELFRQIAPGSTIECMENGVDFGLFDPSTVPLLAELQDRRFLVFVGTMDYFPNVDAACWFAKEIFPELRCEHPGLEFFVVGNHPNRRVRVLASLPGVHVTGGVPDVRPYVQQSAAVVAPLRLARGIQNKVLEALVLGRPVFASTPVIKTFGGEVPAAVVRCNSLGDYRRELKSAMMAEPRPDASIREAMRERFTWQTNVQAVVSRVESIAVAQRRPEGIGNGHEHFTRVLPQA